MRYHDLDLEIGKREARGYPLRACCRARRGHGEAADAAPVDLDALAQGRHRLERGDIDAPFLRRWGSLLYDTLFRPHTLGSQLDRCIGATLDADHEGVRLRLRIDPDAPEMAALPWEFLFAPDRNDAAQGAFLGASVRSPVVRYLDTRQPMRILETAPPLRLLVVVPAYTGLDTEREKNDLLSALDSLAADGLVEPVFLEGPGRTTRTGVGDALREEAFHVLHFIGHGGFDGDAAHLVLNGDDSPEDHVPESWWAGMLANHGSMKLVVLNACQGAAVSAAYPFTGLAPRLVRAGVPAVVAMQYPVSDAEAICFSQVFYHSLFKGADRGRVDVATAHARNQLRLDFPNARSVGAPVLFMRAPDGLLFAPPATRPVLSLLAPDALDTARARLRTHEHNIETTDDPAVADAERRARNLLRRHIRLRHAALVSTAGVALLLFFLLWMNLFEGLPSFFKPEFYTVWLADRAADGDVHDALLLVPITAGSEPSALGPFGASWRAHHAALIDRLSAAGARVIAFDVFFPAPSPHDSLLAAALRAAADAGTTVILGAADRTPGGPALTPMLAEAAGGWGMLCMGASPGYPANVFPLLARPGNTDGMPPLPSLALATVAAYEGGARYDLDAAQRQVNLFDPEGRAVERLGYTATRTVRAKGGCPILRPGDTIAEMVLDYTRLDALRARRIPYESIVLDPEATNSGRFVGKIVLVGLERPDEAFPIYRGVDRETRYGYELHADAVNTLLHGIVIRRLANVWQFLIILGMALAGAAVALAPLPGGRLGRIGASGGVLAAYLAGAVLLYVQSHLFLNALYHVLAFLVSYRTVRWLQRRYFR